MQIVESRCVCFVLFFFFTLGLIVLLIDFDDVSKLILMTSNCCSFGSLSTKIDSLSNS